MRKFVRTFYIGLPVILLFFGIFFSEKSIYLTSLEPLLILFMLLYIIQLSLVPLFNVTIRTLTAIHLISYLFALYLVFNTQMKGEAIGYGGILIFLLWITDNLKIDE